MSWGLEKSGFQAVGAIDNWLPALRTFEHNHPGAKTWDRDIRTIGTDEVLAVVGPIDIIVGGPPCQGFSKNVPATYRFLEDPRNLLFREYLRFVEAIRPSIVVMENVAEIFAAYGGSVRDEIVDRLTEMGYSVAVKVVNTADYGVPQRRRRCIFLAVRDADVVVFPQPTHGLAGAPTLFGEEVLRPYVTAWDAISDLPRILDGEEFVPAANPHAPENEYQEWARKDGDVVFNQKSAKLRPVQRKRYESLQPGQGIKDLPDDLRPRGGYSGAYGRLDFTSQAPTITRWVFHAGSGRYGHPREVRIITMREAARLQGFTDDFEFVGTNNEIAGQIGNAVPPRLMAAFASTIRAALQGEGSPREILQGTAFEQSA